ncbi:hypothetical protein ACIRL2_14880 [Embleya sp. NPDC127516]|uniref:hypothetical protein n=1 Tax=Embleya sp. NPDC127516 TaxID=3363990 RepID=UPI0038059E4C
MQLVQMVSALTTTAARRLPGGPGTLDEHRRDRQPRTRAERAGSGLAVTRRHPQHIDGSPGRQT